MDVSPASIAIALLIGAGAVVAMLHILSVRAQHETTVHDLKVRTHRLRLEYAERLAKMRARLDDEIEVVSPGIGGSTSGQSEPR